jgi:hypothetical protein
VLYLGTIMYYIGKKVESLCLTNETLCHVDVWGSGCIDPEFS